MRLKLFLFAALAVVASAGSYLELSARCRCDRPERGGRRAAKQERKAARRGYSSNCDYVPATPSSNPYDNSGVEPLGPQAAAIPKTAIQYQWQRQCTRGGCNWVSVPVEVPVTPSVKAVPVPDPAFQKTVTPTAPQEKTPPKEEPAVEELQATGAATVEPVYTQEVNGKIWRTGADGKRTQIIVLDDREMPIGPDELPKPYGKIEFMRLSDFAKVSDIPKTWGNSAKLDPATEQRWLQAEAESPLPETPAVQRGPRSPIPQLDE